MMFPDAGIGNSWVLSFVRYIVKMVVAKKPPIIIMLQQTLSLANQPECFLFIYLFILLVIECFLINMHTRPVDLI